MSQQKKKYKRHARVGSIERNVLEKLAAGDLLVGYLCSAMSSKRMYQIARARARKRYLTNLAINRLEKAGYIDRVGDLLSINNRGQELIANTINEVRASLAVTKWDGKWRVIIFDIPQELSRLRIRIREVLKRAGFRKLQQSVWLFPHECIELAQLIKQDPRVNRHVLYGVFESIDGDTSLRKSFGI